MVNNMQQPLETLIERLKSADPQVRAAAIQDIARSNDPAAIAALGGVFKNDPDPRLRELAKQAAVQIQAGATNASPPGEKVYQMLWDCRFCGTTKLLGIEHRHCPNCGAAQDPAWRYFPSDADLKVINDPNYRYAGADKTCPFCGQPNSAAAQWCKDCGGDLSAAPEVARKADLQTGLEGPAGVRDDVVLQKFQREQAAIQAQSQGARKGGLGRVKYLIIAAVVLCIGAFAAFVVLSRSTYGASMAVSELTWQRVISVEQLTAQSGSDWRSGVPADAYNVACHSEDRCRTESEQYVCGSVNVDRGDGSFTKQDKYCTRSKQVCEPDQKCSYTVNHWTFERDFTATGGPADPLPWPSVSLQTGSFVGAERESSRKETLNVVFKDSAGQSYTYNPTDYAVWQTYKVGQRYTVEINRLNQVQWNTLKPASAQ
jgi:hypothetical protein